MPQVPKRIAFYFIALLTGATILGSLLVAFSDSFRVGISYAVLGIASLNLSYYLMVNPTRKNIPILIATAIPLFFGLFLMFNIALEVGLIISVLSLVFGNIAVLVLGDGLG